MDRILCGPWPKGQMFQSPVLNEHGSKINKVNLL